MAFSIQDGRRIQERLLQAIKPLEKELGITLSSKGFTYGSELVVKFKCNREGDDSDEEKFKAALPRALKDFGLPESLSGRVLSIGGKDYTLYGYRLTRGSKPFLLRRDGKTYTATFQQIKAAAGSLTPA